MLLSLLIIIFIIIYIVIYCIIIYTHFVEVVRGAGLLTRLRVRKTENHKKGRLRCGPSDSLRAKLVTANQRNRKLVFA